MKQYEVAGHAPSLVPEGKNWKLVFSDEFDGRELDRSKWDFRREIMGTWHKAWCGEEGVELDGQSNCVFKLTEKEGEVCSAQLQTGYNFMDAVKDDAGTKYSGGLNWPIAPLKENKYLHAHGYYECRCRLLEAGGLVERLLDSEPDHRRVAEPGAVGRGNRRHGVLPPGRRHRSLLPL